MSRLPFEIGYASSMSDAEMMDLDNELARRNFWADDEVIKDLVERYIKHFWRGPNGHGYHGAPPHPMHLSAPRGFREAPSGVEYTHRTITISVPECLTEELARILVDMQLREQWFAGYCAQDDE